MRKQRVRGQTFTRRTARTSSALRKPRAQVRNCRSQARRELLSGIRWTSPPKRLQRKHQTSRSTHRGLTTVKLCKQRWSRPRHRQAYPLKYRQQMASRLTVCKISCSSAKMALTWHARAQSLSQSAQCHCRPGSVYSRGHSQSQSLSPSSDSKSTSPRTFSSSSSQIWRSKSSLARRLWPTPFKRRSLPSSDLWRPL